MIVLYIELYKSLIKKFWFWFYFLNRELLRCDLFLLAVHELETVFLGGEAMGRCFTLVTLCMLGSCHTFLHTK